MVCKRLLIRRSLVRAQVGEPTSSYESRAAPPSNKLRPAFALDSCLHGVYYSRQPAGRTAPAAHAPRFPLLWPSWRDLLSRRQRVLVDLPVLHDHEEVL